MKKNALVQATALVTILTVASKLLGFARDQIVALYFGASGATDAFIVAQTVPNMLSMFVLAALGTAFLPIYSERLAESGPDARERQARLSDTIFTFTLAFSALIAIAGVAFAPALVRIVSPGFTGETYRLAVLMTRIIFPGVIFGALIVPAKAVLNAHYHFAAPAAAAVAQNACTIATLVALASLFQFGIVGLAIGWLIGFVASFLIQLPALRKHGFRLRLRLDLSDDGVRKTLMLAWPIIAGAVFGQVYQLIDRGLASSLAEGSIAVLSFADKLRQLPLGIFSTAVVTVIYPVLAELVNRQDKDGVKEALGGGLRLVSLLTLPAACGLAVLRGPLVRMLFEYGAFDAAATAATANALLWYAVGMLGLAINQVLVTTLYSLRDAKTPMVIAALGALINIGLDYALVGPLGAAGLALANSLSALVITVLYFLAIRRKLGAAGYTRTAVSIGKIGLASAGMCVTVSLAARFAPLGIGQPRTIQAIAVLGLVGLGCVVYLALAALLRVEELVNLRSMLQARLSRRKAD